MDLDTLFPAQFGQLTFTAGAPHTITRSLGTWNDKSPDIRDYTRPGSTITITGTALNDGTYTVVGLSGGPTVLEVLEPLVNEGPIGAPVVVTGTRQFSLAAGYPPHTTRHLRSGDTNPPSRNAGAPSDPLLAIRQRAFIGDSPAYGFPLVPATARYPAGTTFIGRGEEVTSEVVNRALYGLHKALDSVAERPRLNIKELHHNGTIAAIARWDLLTFDPDGLGVPDNRHLVYLGPPGSLAADAKKYIRIFENWGLLRTANLDVVEAGDVYSWGMGNSLYHFGAIPTPGFFPDGDSGVITGLPAPTDFDSSGAGFDTAVDNLQDRCFFNYSLATRLAQADSALLWRAFAIVTTHAPGLAAKTNQTDLTFGGAGDLGWKLGDVIYYSTIAFAPTIRLNKSAGVNPVTTKVVSAGFDRVMDGDGPEPVEAFMEIAGRYILQPCVEIGIMGMIFGHDGHNAMVRCRNDLTDDSVGLVSTDVDQALGNAAFGAFLHLQQMGFGGDTILAKDPTNEIVTIAPPGRIQLVNPALQWANVPPGDTDLIVGRDMVEIYEWTAMGAGRLLGIWVINQIVNASDADLMRIDGDVAGMGIPAQGYVRVVRPMLREGSTEHGAKILPGLNLLTQKRLGVVYPALNLVGSYDDADLVLDVRDRDSAGIVSAVPRAVLSAGGQHYTRARTGGYNFFPDGEHVHYHQVVMANGQGPLPNWIFVCNPIGTMRAFWFLSAFLGTESDVVVFPVNLPDGVTVTELIAHYGLEDPLPIAGFPKVRLYRKQRNAVVPPDAWIDGTSLVAADIPMTDLGGVRIDTTVGLGVPATWLVFSSNNGRPGTNPISEVIDNENNEYYVIAHACWDGVAPRSEILMGIRLTYTMTKLLGV